MAYNTLSDMKNSFGLLGRIAAAAAMEGVDEPDSWATTNMWKIISRSDWVDAWEYAKATQTMDHNPDTGMRPGVITDQMILAAVQDLLDVPNP